MIISVANMTKQFGSLKAVDDASFEVAKGEVVGFVGANGAGKSTTINAMLGFITPTAGKIMLFNQLVSTNSAHIQHARLGYAAGDMELPGTLTGKQYLSFLMHQYGKDVSKRLIELEKILKPQLDKKIGTLSRGNKQKVALIAAFMTKPELVILDEPTSGLDPIMQEVFIELVREEAARGTTIFMSSHYLTEVADVCSRVILMRQGKIIEDLSSDQLLAASGKKVSLITGYKRTQPPKGALDTIKETDANGNISLEFIWKQPPNELQQWLAGVKQLIDIEITEDSLDGVFKEMYATEKLQQGAAL